MKTFIVKSSLGTITANAETGDVLDVISLNESEESYLNDIKTFDLKRYKEYYKREIENTIDIIYLGFWTKSGVYDPAFYFDEERINARRTISNRVLR